jgi:hypothetical protein
MRISTTQVSSVMLQSKKVGNQGGKNVKTENQTECHEIKPNLSKDRAMPEGYNFLF